MHRVDQAAARDRQPEPVAQQRRDLAVGETVTLIEQHRAGDRLGPQLHGGGAERVGGLQRMAALHATAALRATTDVDVEAAHDRPLHGQFFLILPRHAQPAHGAGAVRTRGRQRCRVGLVDVRRHAPMSAPAIGGTRLATGPPRLGDARPAREGRGLPIHRSARRLELLFQLLVFSAQALALGFRAPQVFFELRDPARLIVDDLLGIVRGRRLVALRHAALMPESRSKYKGEMRVSTHCLRGRAERAAASGAGVFAADARPRRLPRRARTFSRPR